MRERRDDARERDAEIKDERARARLVRMPTQDG